MKQHKIRDKIKEVLSHSTIGVNQIKLSDKITPEELNDLINQVTYSLPLYPEEQVYLVGRQVLASRSEEELLEILMRDTKDLIRLLLLNNINTEQLSLLIFNLMVGWELTSKGSITKQLDKTKEYFLSHLIENDIQLRKEVQFNPVEGITRTIGDQYIRVDKNLSFIPTSKTIKKFSNYLFNHKHI